MTNAYDVIIIGSGPGGYIAAIRAAQLGLKTAIVEREHLGGICLNWGCIPAKALLRSAEILHYFKNAKDYGITINGSVSPDIGAIVKRSRNVSARLNAGVEFLMKKNGIDVIWGKAKLASSNTVQVENFIGETRRIQHPKPEKTKGQGLYKASHIILATGAQPKIIPGIEPDGKLIWSFFEAMIPSEIPKSLLIMGSGAIGMEFASFYQGMGTEVSVLEILPRILPSEDEEISVLAKKHMEKQGIKFLTETKIINLKKEKNSIILNLEGKGKKLLTLEVDRFLSAVGVEGNIKNLGLEALGVKIENGCIATDNYGCTNISGIYAVGDVSGPPMLAHKAEHEGVTCIEKIATGSSTGKKSTIPRCVYTYPQLASVGISESQAKKEGRDIRVGRFPFSSNGKAIALGEDQGLIKTIFDQKSGELLGVHMIGAEVTELIHSCVLAMNMEITEEEFFHTIFPHPTLSEITKESVLSAFGRALNQ